jgi:hypothetical protein
MSNSSNSNNTSRTDTTGKIYSTPVAGPAPAGTPVTIHGPNGGSGVLIGSNTVVKTS